MKKQEKYKFGSMRKLQLCIVFNSTVLIAACSLIHTVKIENCDYPSPAKEASEHTPASRLSALQKTKYEAVQSHIETQKNAKYHEAVIDPDEFRTEYSFYLLGFEKPHDQNPARPYCCGPEDTSYDPPIFNPTDFKGSSDDKEKEIQATRDDINANIFTDKYPLVLTHILRTGEKQAPNLNKVNSNSCFVFNIYGDNTETPWCKNSHKIKELDKNWKREGWAGLNQLAADVKERADREMATHIILLATGWNTPQYESYLDFKAWITQIAADFDREQVEFRPIFIGTSWDSAWEGSVVASQATVANDADEIGFTWENYLLNDLMRPIAKSSNAKLIVIGHSFGSRVALGAHYVRDILVRTTPVVDVPVKIIGLQAAFPIARFVTTNGKEHQYVGANKGNAEVVITSSEHDGATAKMCLGTKYVGAGCGVDELKKNPSYKGVVTVLNTQEDGNPVTSPVIDRVSIYDASPFVKCQLEGTESGAHSDVYDKEMGHFLGEIIRN